MNRDQAAAEEDVIRDRLAESVEKQEDRVLKLEASVFQLANYNFVFQGVILSAVISGASILKCRHFWFPLSLSLIGAVLNFVTLLTISQKYNHYLNQLDRKIEIWYRVAYQSCNVDRLREKHRKQKMYRKLALVSSMILFLAFSAIMVAATKVIPCLHHDHHWSYHKIYIYIYVYLHLGVSGIVFWFLHCMCCLYLSYHDSNVFVVRIEFMILPSL